MGFVCQIMSHEVWAALCATFIAYSLVGLSYYLAGRLPPAGEVRGTRRTDGEVRCPQTSAVADSPDQSRLYGTILKMLELQGNWLWNRWHFLLLANSFFLGGVGMMLQGNASAEVRWDLISVAAAGGAMLCVAWHLIVVHGGFFYNMRMAQARRLEALMPRSELGCFSWGKEVARTAREGDASLNEALFENVAPNDVLTRSATWVWLGGRGLRAMTITETVVPGTFMVLWLFIGGYAISRAYTPDLCVSQALTSGIVPVLLFAAVVVLCVIQKRLFGWLAQTDRGCLGILGGLGVSLAAIVLLAWVESVVRAGGQPSAYLPAIRFGLVAVSPVLLLAAWLALSSIRSEHERRLRQESGRNQQILDLLRRRLDARAVTWEEVRDSSEYAHLRRYPEWSDLRAEFSPRDDQ